jgi:hypothetical protein
MLYDRLDYFLLGELWAGTYDIAIMGANELCMVQQML